MINRDGASRFLANYEIIDFRERQLWPYINDLYGGDFIGSAEVGSEFVVPPYVSPQGGVAAKVTAEIITQDILMTRIYGDDDQAELDRVDAASTESDYLGKEVSIFLGTRLCLVNTTLERRIPMAGVEDKKVRDNNLLLAGMTALANRGDFASSVNGRGIRHDELEVWRVDNFNFNSDNSYPGSHEYFLKLQSEGGEVVWTDDDMKRPVWHDPLGPEDFDTKTTIADFEDDHTALESAHLLSIQTIFRKLGIQHLVK